MGNQLNTSEVPGSASAGAASNQQTDNAPRRRGAPQTSEPSAQRTTGSTQQSSRDIFAAATPQPSVRDTPLRFQDFSAAGLTQRVGAMEAEDPGLKERAEQYLPQFQQWLERNNEMAEQHGMEPNSYQLYSMRVERDIPDSERFIGVPSPEAAYLLDKLTAAMISPQ